MLAIIFNRHDFLGYVRDVPDGMQYGQYVYFRRAAGSDWELGWIAKILNKKERERAEELSSIGYSYAIKPSEYQKIKKHRS